MWVTGSARCGGSAPPPAGRSEGWSHCPRKWPCQQPWGLDRRPLKTHQILFPCLLTQTVTRCDRKSGLSLQSVHAAAALIRDISFLFCRLRSCSVGLSHKMTLISTNQSHCCLKKQRSTCCISKTLQCNRWKRPQLQSWEVLEYKYFVTVLKYIVLVIVLHYLLTNQNFI